MLNGFARKGARRLLEGLMSARMRRCADEELARSAVIFAPHPDDETLGCGGTIVRKRSLGASVSIVVLTDGSVSHRRFIDSERLRSIREEEARAAAEVLGVAKDLVYFLRFVDHELEIRRDQASERVLSLVDSMDFDQVFIPYVREPVSDHAAANWIVLAALRRMDRGVTVYEYPVWFWKHWPWVAEEREESGGLRTLLRKTMFQVPRMVAEFHCSVDVTGVLDIKREALNCHRTQTTRVLPEKDWPILADVAGGTFVECFFRGHEVFRRYRVSGRIAHGEELPC